MASTSETTSRTRMRPPHFRQRVMSSELAAFKMVADERGKMIPLLAAQNEDLRAQNQALMKQVDSMQQQMAFMVEHPICLAPPAQP